MRSITSLFILVLGFLTLMGCGQFINLMDGPPSETAVPQETGWVVSDDHDRDGFSSDEGDCNDGNTLVAPDRPEFCDGIDNDCDGLVDDDDPLNLYDGVDGVFDLAFAATRWFVDSDSDGFGSMAKSTLRCEAPDGHVENDLDCDDSRADVNPEAPELCDSLDNDCDGLEDDEDEAVVNAPTWYADIDGDGYGDVSNSTEACEALSDFVDNSDDCNDGDVDINPDANELCDSLDNDCDVDIDEEAVDAPTWYVDNDDDGYGNATSSIEACEAPSNFVTNSDDCDDSRADVNPEAPELCDGLATDEDCDGLADDDDPSMDLSGRSTLYFDSDSDGYGDPDTSGAYCRSPTSQWIEDSADCDDARSDVNPGENELCDGFDNDCDGSVDEPSAIDAVDLWDDDDSDGYGDDASGSFTACPADGFVDVNGDCNDADAAINPDAIELCDSLDNNCDGDVDEGVTATYYFDADGDGHGDLATSIEACEAPSGYVNDFTDCDDTESAAFPGAPELCDSLDNDCDGRTDEEAPTWYRDADSDGYGDVEVAESVCEAPSGYVSDASDCDDSNPDINPGAPELCDSLDNNCDGDVDEEALTWYYDADGDGYGNPATEVVACEAPFGYIALGGDCDDGNINIFTGAGENPWTVWDDGCDGFAHDDGTIYTTRSSIAIVFTGPNLVSTSDSTFVGWDSASTAWDVYVSTYDSHTVSDLSVASSAWTSGGLVGEFATLRLPGGSGSTSDSECESLTVNGLMSGAQYGITFVVRSSGSGALWVETDASPIEYVEPSVYGEDFVGGFVADASSEVLVFCHGLLNPDRVDVTHVWVGPASF
ncbi:MAG: putative metal-binding motif-containing protein [Patescibacteria group bacterium]|jgi:hypothetical protein